MSRRTDLEEHMHTSYEIIREYERMILTSGRPEERQRARDEVSRQWACIKDYLAEYQKLVPTPWSNEIAELAAHFTGATPSPIVGPSNADLLIQIKTRISEKDRKEMVYVPAGVFLYGDDKEKRTLDAFWIDRTPVTNAEYARFVAETGHEPPKHWQGTQPPQKIADHPVVWVTWHDAAAYAEWAGKRLPTEEQWEKAASWDPDKECKRRYPWGDRWYSSRCNTEEGGKGGTTPVGAYSPRGDSFYGCADMAGNVDEWTASKHERFPDTRVVRGGAWFYDRDFAVCAARYDYPGDSFDYFGFRCVSPISPSES